MALMLDTSILVDVEKNVFPTISLLKQISVYEMTEASISFITYFEYLQGLKDKSTLNRQKRMAWINQFDFLEATRTTSDLAAYLKLKYESKGIVFSLSDLFIITQAFEHNLPLVTKDKYFERVEEVNIIVV
ncbi:type II toxin-antitoxin system VapC family toxin [Candidatus Woesearchaeota archaeon]|nr:type II toxin-antitoxin system VapC family toxin [Candidatus Woesearchaeota archaeon]